jgi:hypothetical protein
MLAKMVVGATILNGKSTSRSIKMRDPHAGMTFWNILFSDLQILNKTHCFQKQ